MMLALLHIHKLIARQEHLAEIGPHAFRDVCLVSVNCRLGAKEVLRGCKLIAGRGAAVGQLEREPKCGIWVTFACAGAFTLRRIRARSLKNTLREGVRAGP